MGNSAYANKELILTRRERILLRVCMYVQYVLAIAAALKGVFSQQGSTVLGIALMVLPLLAAIGMGAVLRLDKRQRKESE